MRMRKRGGVSLPNRLSAERTTRIAERGCNEMISFMRKDEITTRVVLTK